jgi:uncharacterized protein (DUF305 family)
VRMLLPVPALLALLTALLLAGCALSSSSPSTPSPVSNSAAASTPPATPYVYYVRDDLQYIDVMVPHHQLAIDMARLAEEFAHHGELKGLAADIIAAQDDEIHRMLTWHAEITGTGDQSLPTALTPGPGPGHSQMPGMNVDLVALAASPDFDRAFIQAMIPHHMAAIDMSRAATPNLKRSDLRDLAHDIITTQQVEIDRMRGWLKAWYP